MAMTELGSEPDELKIPIRSQWMKADKLFSRPCLASTTRGHVAIPRLRVAGDRQPSISCARLKRWSADR